jgi:predicted phosphoadenosine phosphosulfate sulfurtransferase
MELGGKKLVVKVDAKTKTVLDEYKGTVSSAVIALYKQYTVVPLYLWVIRSKTRHYVKMQMILNTMYNVIFV